MVLCKAVERVRGVCPLAADALAACLSQYAELLAAQGSMSTAITYLGDSQQVCSLICLQMYPIHLSSWQLLLRISIRRIEALLTGV